MVGHLDAPEVGVASGRASLANRDELPKRAVLRLYNYGPLLIPLITAAGGRTTVLSWNGRQLVEFAGNDVIQALKRRVPK